MGKPVIIFPVTGFMDTRGTPDEVPFGGYRLVQNFHVTHKNRLQTMTGFRKFLDKTDYNNQDLHLQDNDIRQPVNLIYHAKLTSGFTKIYAATQNRIYALNAADGNWITISSGLGGQGTSAWPSNIWTAAHIGSEIVFTNDLDKPVAHTVEQPVGDDGSSVRQIDDLNELNVTKVAIAVSWNNLVLLMNMEMDGERYANRVMWSDYKRPLSYVPSSASLAGYTDLPAGEVILNAKALQDKLFIYTNTGIWEVNPTGGDEVLSFRKRYVPDEAGSRCLAYKRTLVSDGTAHYFMGRDGVYKYDFYTPYPQLVDYIHRASSLIFDDIRTDDCGIHCGGFDPRYRQIKFSWAKSEDMLPSSTMVIGTEFPFTSIEDHGYTAFCNSEPTINVTTKSFLLGSLGTNDCICTEAELESFDDSTGFCVDPDYSRCVDTPNFFLGPIVRAEQFTSDEGLFVEDWEQNPIKGSLCHLLGSMKVSDLCSAEQAKGQCNAGQVFIMASSEDLCLKESADVYYREICVSFEQCGNWYNKGYVPTLISGALGFNAPDSVKVFAKMLAEITNDTAMTPSVNVSVGCAAQAIDPLTASGQCQIFWEAQDAVTVRCMDEATLAANEANNLVTDQNYEWPLYMKGKYLYFMLTLTNSTNPNQPNTNSYAAISRFEFDVSKL